MSIDKEAYEYGFKAPSWDRVGKMTTSIPKVMYVVPNIIGFSGDAVNERQLAKALSKYSVVEVYSLIPLQRIRELKRANYLRGFKKVILIPVVMFPYFVGAILALIAGLPYALIAALRRPKLVYVRSSILALPFLWLKKLHKAMVVVKIVAISEDGARRSGPFRSFMLDLKLFSWISSLADRYVLANSDRIAVPSPLLYMELCKRRATKSPQPPIMVPAGVDLEKIDKMKKPVEKAVVGVEEEFTIGFVGWLEWWQGVDILVKSLHILNQKCAESERNYRFRLLIVGDGPLRSRVERLCRELKVNCIITGFIPHEDALEYLASMDVLVVPRLKTSVTESVVPIKVLEAWALGVPVVITRHKVFEWLGLRDGEDLIYCEPNPVSVADAICKLLRDPQLRIKMSLRGYELAKRSGYDVIAMRLLKASVKGV